MAPIQWPLARVVKVHTGHDGVVRVVTLRLVIEPRPVTKVVDPLQTVSVSYSCIIYL